MGFAADLRRGPKNASAPRKDTTRARTRARRKIGRMKRCRRLESLDTNETTVGTNALLERKAAAAALVAAG